MASTTRTLPPAPRYVLDLIWIDGSERHSYRHPTSFWSRAEAEALALPLCGEGRPYDTFQLSTSRDFYVARPVVTAPAYSAVAA